jgi:hypothetical protein
MGSRSGEWGVGRPLPGGFFFGGGGSFNECSRDIGLWARAL